MEKYIHLFETNAEFEQAYNTNKYKEPWLSYTKETKEVHLNKDFNLVPFAIKALSSGNITWALDTKTLQYSKNNADWQVMDSSTVIPVIKGDYIRFKGTNTNYKNNIISSTAQFAVEGNIMSLTNADDFKVVDTVNDEAFYYLFKNCNNLISAINLRFPATILGKSCYYELFQNCVNLTDAPEILPAMTMEEVCYGYMFDGCKSLLVAPKLPATKMKRRCYFGMFYGCENLIVGPELPATELADGCYELMFRDCKNLTTASELPATEVPDGCYFRMFEGCNKLTKAPTILPAIVVSNQCYSRMFQDCSSLETAPILPATALDYKSYYRMFYWCTKLKFIKAMFIDPSLAQDCIYQWVEGITGTGTFVKNSAAVWNITGSSGVPTNWTIETADS